VFVSRSPFLLWSGVVLEKFATAVGKCYFGPAAHRFREICKWNLRLGQDSHSLGFDWHLKSRLRWMWSSGGKREPPVSLPMISWKTLKRRDGWQQGVSWWLQCWDGTEDSNESQHQIEEACLHSRCERERERDFFFPACGVLWKNSSS